MLSRSVGSVGSRFLSEARLRVFLRFAGLSGLGWLLDVAVLLALVGLLGVPPFVANIVSSCVAALSVFLISRLLIFDGVRTALGVRVLVYLAYTLCMILLAAAVLQELVEAGRAIAAGQGWRVTPTLLTAMAKVIVTPPQLLMNFAMARYMSERAFGARVRHAG